MNDDRSLERAARSWIEAGPTQAPESAVAAALQRIETTAQERDLRIPWRTPRTNRLALAGAAVAMLFAVAIGGSLSFGWLPTAPLPGVTATLQPSDPPPSTSSPVATDSPAPTPESVAVTISSGHSVGGNGGSTVWVVNEDGTDARDLFPETLFAELIGRTSDGRHLLVKLRDGFVPEYTIALADVETGDVQPVPTDCPTEVCWADEPQNVTVASLSGDGSVATIVLVDQSRGSVMVGTVELATGATSIRETTRQPDAGSEVLVQPVLSPDGRSIAYILSDPRCILPGGGALMVASMVAGSPPRQLLPAEHCALSPRWSPGGSELVVTTGEPTDAGDPAPSEYHDIYLVRLADGAPQRITTDRMSNFGAWTRDGRISYAVVPLDSGNMPTALDVWIEDPSTGEATKVDGTLQALSEAGCLECPLIWNASEVKDHVVAIWSRE